MSVWAHRQAVLTALGYPTWDLDEAHARAERAESEFRGVARRQA